MFGHDFKQSKLEEVILIFFAQINKFTNFASLNWMSSNRVKITGISQLDCGVLHLTGGMRQKSEAFYAMILKKLTRYNFNPASWLSWLKNTN